MLEKTDFKLHYKIQELGSDSYETGHQKRTAKYQTMEKSHKTQTTIKYRISEQKLDKIQVLRRD